MMPYQQPCQNPPIFGDDRHGSTLESIWSPTEPSLEQRARSTAIVHDQDD